MVPATVALMIFGLFQESDEGDTTMAEGQSLTTREAVREVLASEHADVCVSDAHEGLRNALARVLGCQWQRCTVHFLRDMLGHCPRQIQPMIATAIRQIVNASSHDQAREHLLEVVARVQDPAPKVARLLEAAEEELLAFYRYPREHWTKLRSTNPLERVNKEIGRRSDVVGIYPNDQALIRRHAPHRAKR